MKDCLLGIALAVVTIGGVSVAFAQGFAEEVDRSLAVIWAVFAVIFFWGMIVPEIGKRYS